MSRRTLVVAAIAWCLSASLTRAEIAPLSDEDLERKATHIVTGEVVAIYDRVTTQPQWKKHQYVAEVRVVKAEKGADVKVGDLIYVRYWSEDWTGPGNPPPGAYGHWDAPKERESFRFFLARNAHDGYSDQNKDGGLNVLGPNGMEKVEVKRASP